MLAVGLLVAVTSCTKNDATTPDGPAVQMPASPVANAATPGLLTGAAALARAIPIDVVTTSGCRILGWIEDNMVHGHITVNCGGRVNELTWIVAPTVQTGTSVPDYYHTLAGAQANQALYDQNFETYFDAKISADGGEAKSFSELGWAPSSLMFLALEAFESGQVH